MTIEKIKDEGDINKNSLFNFLDRGHQGRFGFYPQKRGQKIERGVW